MSLELKNVSKSFVGKKAVDNISFSLTKPGVYGLLGTNGAGKTTTIRKKIVEKLLGKESRWTENLLGLDIYQKKGEYIQRQRYLIN